MSSFSSIVTALTSSGLTGSALTSAVQSVFQASPRAAVMAGCSVLLSNSQNPTVIKDEVTKMAETPNLPVAVANLLPELLTATSPSQVAQIVQAIEVSVPANFLGF
jgi:hypothetical protein